MNALGLLIVLVCGMLLLTLMSELEVRWTRRRR
jgi:hypothetical protein